jgi:phage I-like protein
MGVSICSQSLGGIVRTEIRILPDGPFRTVDGRPENLQAWVMNSSQASLVISNATAKNRDIIIDYEHQSLQSAKNGQPIPAAGWFGRMEWREGEGLYAVAIRWTEKASTLISSGEYRFISPVFQFDSQGYVTDIISVSLTNNPAIPSLTDFAALSVRGTIVTPLQHLNGMSDRGAEALAQLSALPAPDYSHHSLFGLEERLDRLNARVYGLHKPR